MIHRQYSFFSGRKKVRALGINIKLPPLKAEKKEETNVLENSRKKSENLTTSSSNRGGGGGSDNLNISSVTDYT
jgi:hypothetical protein